MAGSFKIEDVEDCTGGDGVMPLAKAVKWAMAASHAMVAMTAYDAVTATTVMMAQAAIVAKAESDSVGDDSGTGEGCGGVQRGARGLDCSCLGSQYLSEDPARSVV